MSNDDNRYFVKPVSQMGGAPMFQVFDGVTAQAIGELKYSEDEAEKTAKRLNLQEGYNK
jgi:hypothetical protein